MSDDDKSPKIIFYLIGKSFETFGQRTVDFIKEMDESKLDSIDTNNFDLSNSYLETIRFPEDPSVLINKEQLQEIKELRQELTNRNKNQWKSNLLFTFIGSLLGFLFSFFL